MRLSKWKIIALSLVLIVVSSSAYSHYRFIDDHKLFHQKSFRVTKLLSDLDIQIDDPDHTTVHLAGLAWSSSNYLHDRLLNRKITLYLPPVGTRDNKNRLLAYIYLENWVCLQREMLAKGLATPISQPHLMAQPFNTDMLKAKYKHAGIWKK